jgi:hypothetical protein
MYNQAQGVYPQVAGSFQNVAGMSPHDNGRVASQVPTFSGGLQGLIGAEFAFNNFAGLTMGQSPMQYRASLLEQQMASRAGIAGGIGTGANLLGNLAAFANPFIGGAMLAGGGVMSSYRDRIDEVLGLRNSLRNSVFNTQMIDPFTGSLKLSTTNQLLSSMKGASSQLGMTTGDLNQVLATAGSNGLLSNTTSVSEVTKRVMDLAKMSKEIMNLGEGITASDAMELQKLMNDMGISGGKFKTMNIGKNLVTAARATGMSLDAALQISGQSAMTFQQYGLGAAAGLNVGSFSLQTANALSRSTKMDPEMLRKLGGAEGLQQALMGGAASTMARFSDAMVLGALKIDPTGKMKIDSDLVDRFVKGHISEKDLITRGKTLTSGMSNFQKNRFMEQLSYSMPDLKSQMSDMVNPEQAMALQGRQISELARKSGISVKQAAYSYFQDPQQAEAFLAYANDFEGVRKAAEVQKMITRGDDLMRSAAGAKRGDIISQAGRAVNKGINAVGDALSGVYDATLGAAGRNLAETDIARLEANKRSMRLLGSGYLTGAQDPDSAKQARGLGFDIGDFEKELPTTTAARAVLKEYVKFYERKAASEGGGGIRLVERYKSNSELSDIAKNEFGINTDDIVTFYGEDINTKVQRAFEGDSTANSVTQFLSGLAPFETNVKVGRTIERMRQLQDVVRSNRDAARLGGQAKGDPSEDVIRNAATQLKMAYRKFGSGEEGNAFDLLNFRVSRGGEAANARLRFLADKYNRDQGLYTEEEEAGRSRALQDAASVLALSPADLTGEFEEDTLSFADGTIKGAGLDVALVSARRGGVRTEDIKNIINAVSRGGTLSDNKLLGKLSSNAAAVALLKALRNSTYVTGTGDKQETKALAGSRKGGANVAINLNDRMKQLKQEERAAYERDIGGMFQSDTALSEGNVINSLNTLVPDNFAKSFEDMLSRSGMGKRSANFNNLSRYAYELQEEIQLADPKDKPAVASQARTKLLSRLNELAKGQSTNPGDNQGSADLPSIMAGIKEGLTNFNTVMQSIASAAASNSSKSVTIELKSAASN